MPPAARKSRRGSRKSPGTQGKSGCQLRTSTSVHPAWSSANSIRRMHRVCCLESRHSQIRSTSHPRSRSSLVTRRSRALLPLILVCHAAAFVFGEMFLPQLWPCQKHPSTKTATLSFGHTKSGRPGRGWCLRHPLKPECRSNEASRSSVVLFPRLRTRDINCARDKPPNVVR